MKNLILILAGSLFASSAFAATDSVLYFQNQSNVTVCSKVISQGLVVMSPIASGQSKTITPKAANYVVMATPSDECFPAKPISFNKPCVASPKYAIVSGVNNLQLNCRK
jgi:hypothetical protein